MKIATIFAYDPSDLSDPLLRKIKTGEMGSMYIEAAAFNQTSEEQRSPWVFFIVSGEGEKFDPKLNSLFSRYEGFYLGELMQINGVY